jgi:hypothetical protein
MSGLAAAGATAPDTLVETPALSMPARTTIEVEDRTKRPAAAAAAAAAGSISEVSIDLTDHLPVGREELQEAVRQSRVMSAVEAPDELSEPAVAESKQPARPERPTPRAPVPAVAESKPAVVRTVPASRPTPMPAEAKQPASRPPATVEAKQPAPPVEVKQPPPVEVRQPPPPVEVRQPPPPVEVKQPPPPVEVKQPPAPVEVKQPAPVEVKQPPPPVEVKQPPVEAKPPVELPKVPEKQPLTPAPPASRFSPVFIVLILLVLGGAGFLVWKFVLNKSDAAPSPTTGAEVTPQVAPPAPPPGPPPKKWLPSKIEMSAGKPETILALFAGKIDWIEAEGKQVQSGDVIMKLQGHKQLEAEVASLTREVERARTEREAAYQARDATPSANEAAFTKAEAKAQAADRVLNTKADQLTRKAEQVEPLYVRLNIDGTLQKVLRKVGDRIPENTPIAIIQQPPAPSATFKIPADFKTDRGVAAPLKVGERFVACEVADWEPKQLRVVCPSDQNLAEGTAVAWELP